MCSAHTYNPCRHKTKGKKGRVKDVARWWRRCLVSGPKMNGPKEIVGGTEMNVSVSLAAFAFYGAFEGLLEAIEKMLAVGFPPIKQICEHSRSIL